MVKGVFAERQLINKVRFVYGEPALVLDADKRTWLVIGDVHLGIERKLSSRGVKLYDLWEHMASKILSIASEFSATGLIMLGDIKDSILYPESWEQREIKSFFKSLESLEVIALRGNHDAHIDELLGIQIKDELALDDFGLFHGNRWPSPEIMSKRTIITGHNHAAVRITDENGGIYSEKAWIIANIMRSNARKFYENPKAKRLLVMPAFNPLITGFAIGTERTDEENINPLFRNDVFSYRNAKVYSIYGNYIGTVESIAKHELKKGNTTAKSQP